MFMKLLNILSSLMLSASCVNGLSSLDHKPSRQIEYTNVVFNFERENIPFYYENNNYNVTTAFSNLVNYNFGAMSFHSYDVYYDTDTLDYMLENQSKVFYLSSAWEDDTDLYFYCIMDDYDELKFGFQFYFLSTISNISQYYVMVTYSFYPFSRANNIFYTTNVLYDFVNPQLVQNANGNSYYLSSWSSSSTNYHYDTFDVEQFTYFSMSFTLLHVASVDSDYIYQTGYNNGHRDGYNEGYELGYRVGKQDGYNLGEGQNAKNLFLSIADTPLLMLRSLFNFQFFGVNFFIIVVGLITFLLVLLLIRKFVK